MIFKDDYSRNFSEEKGLHDFLENIETSAQWETTPVNSLRVLTTEKEMENLLVDGDSEKEEIIKDTCHNTGLVLKIGRYKYPIGSTALQTLENRARISGSSLSALEKPMFAKVLNECLKVSRGESLIRIASGKVRAAHAGDLKDYAVLPMPELFSTASSFINGEFQETNFQSGYYDHSITTAVWTIKDEELTDTYQQILKNYGINEGGDLSAAIRVSSSDTGVSGANIYYQLRFGNRHIALGNSLKLVHRSGATVKKFAQNLTSVFSQYKQALEGLTKLLNIHINYPENVMAGMMKQVGINKKLTAYTVDKYDAVYGPDSCTAHQVYYGICECISLAAASGLSGKNLVDLEENVARCLSLKWSNYDFPGQVRY